MNILSRTLRHMPDCLLVLVILIAGCAGIPFQDNARPSADAVATRSWIAYVQTDLREGGEYDLYLMRPDGSERRQLTDLPGIETSPAWSPDGQTLAFVATQDSPDPADCATGFVEFTCNFEIYTIRVDGTGLTRVTNQPTFDRDPAWSHDGTRLLFTAREAGMPFGHIFHVAPDGSDPVQLTDGEQSTFGPVWSPDGSRIAFTRVTETEYDVVVMNTDGSNPTRLTQGGLANVRPAWSPDGQELAWIALSGDQQNPRSELAVMNADGSEPEMLPTDLMIAPGYTPAWSPDGRQLLFVVQAAERLQLYRIDRNGSNLTQLTDATFFASAPAWSPVER